VQVGAAAKVVRFALHQRSGRPFGVVDDGAGGGDDLLVGGIVVGLAVVDVDELKTGVNSGLRRLDARAVVEVDVHLHAVLGTVVVDQRAQVGQTDHVGLGVAELDKYRSVLGTRGSNDREERLRVIDIKRADGEALCAGALHQRPRSLHGAGYHRSALTFAAGLLTVKT
jgi:hypothetical protein